MKYNIGDLIVWKRNNKVDEISLIIEVKIDTVPLGINWYILETYCKEDKKYKKEYWNQNELDNAIRVYKEDEYNNLEVIYYPVKN